MGSGGGPSDSPVLCRHFFGWYGSGMKVRDVLLMLHDDGWFVAVTRGSHRQLKHPAKPGRVTVAGKPSDELAPGTLNSILKQAGLKT